MLEEGDILYVDTGTINRFNPRIYEIQNTFFVKNRAWCVCNIYYESFEAKNQHIKLSSIENYIERPLYDKEVACILLDEAELAKFLLER